MSDYGCFTTMRVEADGVRGLALHRQRLTRDSVTLFGSSVADAVVRAALTSALAGVSAPVVARITVTASDFDRARPGGDELRADVALREAPADASDGLGPLRLAPIRHDRSLPAVKHVALAPELYARRQAQVAGYDDAVFLDASGRVGEGPTWGLGLVRDRTLVLPAADVLPSVTMRLLATLVHVPEELVEEPVEVDRLAAYDACFVVSAVSGIRRVASIGEVAFALDHPLLGELSAGYSALPRTPVADWGASAG